MHIDQPQVAAEGELGNASSRDVIPRDEGELRVAEYCLDKGALKLPRSVERTEAPGCAVKPIGGRLTITGSRLDRRTEKDRTMTELVNPENSRPG